MVSTATLSWDDAVNTGGHLDAATEETPETFQKTLVLIL